MSTKQLSTFARQITPRNNERQIDKQLDGVEQKRDSDDDSTSNDDATDDDEVLDEQKMV
ncbi:UNKNOWN [Stylonychia lemnae]|uniref:Uncharacterized protein n=1 Tax=Stylonychia lemnae TaxID=5949 RepID=A0A078ATS4_STYLE|nr:UNKNOWN [Stylonychia lemnae]|eukprot:CDW85649.1 UNKNOWN [Stylonychia lemnae]